MNKINPEVFKLLEMFLSTKNQNQSPSQYQSESNSSLFSDKSETEPEDDYPQSALSRCREKCPPHCVEKCPPHCREKCPPYCVEKCPPRCVEKCPPHCVEKCPPHCREKCPSHCEEKWPWEKKRIFVDNKINCGDCRHKDRRPYDGERDELHDHYFDPKEAVYQPEEAAYQPGDAEYQPEGREDHGKPFDEKEKKIIIENIVNCGDCKSHKKHDGDDKEDHDESAFAYLYFLQVGGSTVAAGADVPLNAADPVKNVDFSAPQAVIQIAGNYEVYYGINGSAVETTTQIALAVNGVPHLKTFIPITTTTGEYSGDAILSLNKNDVLTIRNVPGGNAITLASLSSVGAQLTLHLID